METAFLTGIQINKARHLNNITIPLSAEERKHLVLTGINGCGKTSVLDSLANFLRFVLSPDFSTEEECLNKIAELQTEMRKLPLSRELECARLTLEKYRERLAYWHSGAVALCPSYYTMRAKYQEGKFIVAYYRDLRIAEAEIPDTVERIELRPIYSINESPGRQIAKYLVNLKAAQAFSKNANRIEQIQKWFDHFRDVLRAVYDDDSLELEFNAETFQFTIHTKGREPFDFNTMSQGYSGLFAIIGDLIMRMEAQGEHSWDVEGIVLIDEMEAHLHVQLQERVFPILTSLFKNLQFIVTTHSPAVLISAPNAVVYDLQNHTLVPNGLVNLPYEGVVEGYLGADRLSKELRSKFEQYRSLVSKQNLTDEDYAELGELEVYLDNIPDFLAIDIVYEYRRLKEEFFSGVQRND